MANGGEQRDSHFILEGVTETVAYGYPSGGAVVAPARTGPAQESVNRDVGVRPVLRTYLDQQDFPCPDPVLIEELGLCQDSRVFDRVTLVVGTKHVKAGLQLVPRWWGVLLVRGGIEGALLDPLRPADENPDQDPRALVELLWRDEALELLADHNAAAGVRSKPRPAVWDRVCEVLDLAQIRAAVRHRLRIRAETSTSA